MKLQVLISTLGEEGIRRVIAANHPKMAEVEYLVAWQQPDSDFPVPEELADRHDFKVITHKSRGLSKNRNVAIENASAPLLLIADDDNRYTPEYLSRVIHGFERHPDWDFISFKYETDHQTKVYPDEEFEFPERPRGYYISSVEMAFRAEVFKDGKIRFNEKYGLGAPVFNSGEEAMLLHDLMERGVKGGFIPKAITFHAGATTQEKELNHPATVMTKGAVISIIYPKSWFFRMLLDGMRARRRGCRFSIQEYCNLFLKGRKLR